MLRPREAGIDSCRVVRNMRVPRGNSSVGRARPCQGRGREFESRFPLQIADEAPVHPGFCFSASRWRDTPGRRTAAMPGIAPSKKSPAWWQSGHVAACKAAYAGSIPTQASPSQTRQPSPSFAMRASIRHACSARMAKSVDARDLKSLGRKAMPVRVRLRAPSQHPIHPQTAASFAGTGHRGWVARASRVCATLRAAPGSRQFPSQRLRVRCSAYRCASPRSLEFRKVNRCR
jgi:hypothetical protein